MINGLKKLFATVKNPFSVSGVATGAGLFGAFQVASSYVENKSRMAASYMGKERFERQYGAGVKPITDMLDTASYVFGGLGLFKMDPLSRIGATVRHATASTRTALAARRASNAFSAYSVSNQSLKRFTIEREKALVASRGARRSNRRLRGLTEPKPYKTSRRGGLGSTYRPSLNEKRERFPKRPFKKSRDLDYIAELQSSRKMSNMYDAVKQGARKKREDYLRASRRHKAFAEISDKTALQPRLGPINVGFLAGVGTMAATGDPIDAFAVGAGVTAGMYATGLGKLAYKNPKAAWSTLKSGAGFTALIGGAAALGGTSAYSHPVHSAAEGRVTDWRHESQKTVSRMDFNTSGLTLALHHSRRER